MNILAMDSNILKANNKYHIGSEVYAFISDKIIKKCRVHKIRITFEKPGLKGFIERDKDGNMKTIATEYYGEEIEYLLETFNTENSRGYDWFKEKDVFESEKEAMLNIK